MKGFLEMMNINRNNYEIFFIDYLDGTLDSFETADLLRFLEENPDLREELDAFDTFTLVPDPELQYPEKDLLRKKNIQSVGPINAQNYQEYLIGRMEGDLSIAEHRILERFLLRNPSVAKDNSLFRSTKLIPDTKVVFPDRRGLKKYPIWMATRQRIFYASAIAAALLLLLVIIRPFGKKEVPQVVEQVLQEQTPHPSQPSTNGAWDSGIPAGTGQRETTPENVPEPEIKSPSGDQVLAFSPSDGEIMEINSPSVYVSQGSIPEGGGFSSLTPVHASIRYQIVNASFDPAKHITAGQRNLYTNALPFLTTTESYAIADPVNDAQHDNEASRGFIWNKLRGIFSGNGGKNTALSNINLWTLADLGVAGINHIADSELRIQRIKNEQGKIVSYALINENEKYRHSRPEE